MAEMAASVDPSRGDALPATPILAPPVFIWPPRPAVKTFRVYSAHIQIDHPPAIKPYAICVSHK